MRDWLALHHLTARTCAELLEQDADGHLPAQNTALPDPPSDQAPALSWPGGEVLWGVTAAALTARMAHMSDVIATAATGTVRNFAPDPSRHPRPFTLYIAEKGLIYTSCRLSGQARDMLVVAHEFGHALQLHATGDRAVPPVLRETCAFLSEDLICQALRQSAPDHARGARSVHAAHRAQDMGQRRDGLRRALRDPEAAYDYNWNYPPARILADRLLAGRDNAAWRALFHGTLTVRDALG